MRDFIFIYWDDLPEKDYKELQDLKQNEILYGSCYYEESKILKEARDEDSNFNDRKKVL